ncbi:hypothetical protein [Emticicia sp. BO119]|uniref:hypothetical protein n=1 Tax=Emticicia sp. BO119 TaxID=2757768 RepID=UPI0015EFFB63|nr:hypothetical protein [Emticicia sp. BO119]MBA4848941.1 hypothetical protein [Emticicia sp. BO119]
MKYILPLIINRRRTNYLDLKNRISQECESFVIELPQMDNPFTILSIDKSKSMQALISHASDIPIHHIHFSVSFDETDSRFIIRLSTSVDSVITKEDSEEENDWKNPVKNQVKTQKKATQEHSTFVAGQIKYTCFDNASEFNIIGSYIDHVPEESIENDWIRCQFVFESSHKEYQSELHFYLAHGSCFHHFGLDFGSESSQLKVSSYQPIGHHYQRKTKSKNLFEMVKDFKGMTESNHDFIQHEPNTDFIKSIFFLKKKLSNFSLKDKFIHNDDELKYLVQKNELNSTLTSQFHQLSNLKLAHKHGEILRFMDFQSIQGERVRSLSLDDLKNQAYSTILKSFIEATLQNVIDEDSRNNYIRFTILVPNIYSIHEVANTKAVINDIFNKLQQTPGYEGQIRAWEVVTVSESDAAFLGYFDQGMHHINPNKYYIIIDCGKGTTDFSIIQTSSNNAKKIKSLYRNGFAGAGNLISYAFFEAMIDFVIKNADNPAETKAFFQAIEKSEKAQMNLIFEKLESLKFQYSNKSNTTQRVVENNWNNAKSGDTTLKNLANSEITATVHNLALLLEKVDGFYDWGGYIENACEAITANIIENIKGVINNIDKNISCDGILLTGRGFLFNPLLEKLKGRLTTELAFAPDLIKMPDEASQLKAICLDGIFTNGYVIHPELVGFPIHISTKKQTQVSDGSKPKFPAFFDFILRLANMQDNYDETKNSYRIDKLDSLKFLIGNTLYTVADNIFYDNKWVESVDLIFTKDGFFARNIDKDNKIIGYSNLIQNSAIDNVTLQYLIPSLFPAKIDTDYIQALKQEVPEPDEELATLISLLPD